MLQGWHRGERSIQQKLGFAGPMSMAYTWIDGEMDEQHREFHTTRLPFIPVTTLDNQHRPWTSIFAGSTGEPGFVSSPSWNRLDMEIKVWEGDPFWENHEHFDGEKMLAAGIGIELSTRRRNKFAGHIFAMRQKKDQFRLKLIVNQAIGNCPKYINLRQLEPHRNTSPVVVHKRPNLEDNERLPDELVDFVREADTIFIGTSYRAKPEEAIRFPSHVGQNQRGGKKGWVRVRSDGKTLVIPDYSGNRLMTSLGNIEATPVAGVTIVDFVTGDVLYLTGDARTAVGHEAQAIMPRQRVVTLLEVTGYSFVRDALPVRQRPGTSATPSPYSPPVRLLAEETAAGTSKYFDEETSVTLASVRLLSEDLATFTWESSKPISIQPGQTAILDFSDMVGTVKYQHMAPWKPTSVNDDRIRTWTVSSAHLATEGTKKFDLTMREKEGGAVTGALFTIARKLTELRPELLDDTRPLGLQVKLVGIAGSFMLSLPSSPSASQEPPATSMLWLAGGIGLTPFMSMLSAIAKAPPSDTRWDVVLALSTREPQVLVPLIAQALGKGTPKLRLVIHVFSQRRIPSFPQLPPTDELEVTFKAHRGRIDASLFDGVQDLSSRKAYMCGPEEFEKSMLKELGERGMKNDAIIRESFEY
ncbi:uncharacterized protein PHACADRAFT_188542 [Phanerochaete carnosa HHB-10118-sp]|uniref:Oxidoreductase FAD/NAD(P)-binding domain-containing protein n=1 Tax=Phanerochaete carnosa (strain HHB-10118-sp) TaxID=650164 RepID=K5VUG8_PHACS|nr:uncharacterized protein PHACADRAFT_188542 [Phanerochaete carnosa HHB-10118-sp]EKM50229.1 hypothetical protein PHACADRAFT_188542 [Phanerochaete carnosa HHB-10118-sp]